MIFNDFSLSEKYYYQWGVLMDKGYQGAAGALRAVTLKDIPVRGLISREDEEYNKKLSSNRMLVEDFFGRLSFLWSVCSAKYVLSEGICDTLLGLNLGFTTYHVSLHKLHDEDREQLTDTDNFYMRKLIESQEKYKRNRKQRLNIGYCFNFLSDSETEQTDERGYIATSMFFDDTQTGCYAQSRH